MDLISWVSPIAAAGALWLGIANKRRLDKQDAREAVKFEIEHIKDADYRLVHTGAEHAWDVSVRTPRINDGVAIEGFDKRALIKPGEVAKFSLYKSQSYRTWPETLTVQWSSPDGYVRKGKPGTMIIRLPPPVISDVVATT